MTHEQSPDKMIRVTNALPRGVTPPIFYHSELKVPSRSEDEEKPCIGVGWKNGFACIADTNTRMGLVVSAQDCRIFLEAAMRGEFTNPIS